MSSGVLNVTSVRDEKKRVLRSYLGGREMVASVVKYKIHRHQNSKCRVTRYLGLFENTNGYSVMCSKFGDVVKDKVTARTS